MPIAHVNTPAVDTTTTGTSANLAMGTVSTGNTIVVGWRYSTSGLNPTLTDNLGNTYTSSVISAFDTPGNSTVGVGYAHVTNPGSCTVTITIDSSATIRFSASEFSGVVTSSAVDKTASGSGSSTTPNAGSMTPVSNGQLFYSVTHSNSSETYTAGTDFTLNHTVPSGAGAQRLAAERYIQTTAASHASDFTKTTSGSWSCAAATFKEAGGPVAPILAWSPVTRVSRGLQNVMIPSGMTPPTDPE